MSDYDYALRIAREGGGPVAHHVRKPHVHKFHVGPIHSSVAGRTDHLPITVESGSYVIPADIISAFGEGNTIAGFKHARRVFGGMPRGQGQQPYNHEGGPYGGGSGTYGQNGKIPYGMARGGYADGGNPTKPEPKGTAIDDAAIRPTKDNPKRLLVSATGPGGVKGIVVPRHMWFGSAKIQGMNEINKARAQVYGSDYRAPLTVGQVGLVHRRALDEHFQKPLPQQVADEEAALQRLKDAKHIARDADTLDESDKLETIRYEKDRNGRRFVAYGSKGTAGHSLYSSGVGAGERLHVVNTCPGQTRGCSGGVDPNGIVDTSHGSCFAPIAESQYPGAAVRRAAHEQAKFDPAMTKDWIIAHTGSLRKAAEAADKQRRVTVFRPNMVDESDTSSDAAIAHLNAQRQKKRKPNIISNSYGKTNRQHDPENGVYVTYSNVGPKTKDGRELPANAELDNKRIDETVLARDATGDYRNRQGNLTPPKNSYLVNDVTRYSDLDRRAQAAIKYAKYWSRPRAQKELLEQEKAQGPEGHFDGDGNPTTPDLAHYGHTTLNGNRYDYQKQHILHPRMVFAGYKKDKKTGKRYKNIVPTDSRFLDDDYLPANRYKSRNGKNAGAILMTTPTESTSNDRHDTEFTHHVGESEVQHALANNGEYEIDSPAQQEASRGKPYVAPQPIKFYAHGGAVMHEHDEPMDTNAFPELSYAAQRHNAHRGVSNPEDEISIEQPKGVPIVAAGGEYVLSPSQVRGIGDGNLDTGHRVLDKFVKDTRAQLIKTLQKLPGPKKD